MDDELYVESTENTVDSSRALKSKLPSVFDSSTNVFSPSQPPINSSTSDIYDGFNNTDQDVHEPMLPISEIVQTKTSAAIRNLHNFIENGHFVLEKGDPASNIVDVARRKVYNIPEPEMEEFYILLEACRVEGRMLHFAEKQESQSIPSSGIMIDFDYYQVKSAQVIETRHFESLIQKIYKLLGEVIDFTPFIKNYQFVSHAFVIRKPKIVPAQHNGKTYFKDGFHILIPEIQITRGLKKYMLNEFTKRRLIETTFRGLDFIENPELMLDKMSASNMVHFLGNSKVDKPAYPLTHAWEIRIDIDDDQFSKTVIPIEQLQQYNLSYELSLVSMFDEINGKPTWLKKQHYDYRPRLETEIQLNLEKTKNGIFNEDDILSIDNSVDILTLGNGEAAYIKKLLSILDIEYATNYEKWFKVICVLARTSPQYKPLAIWFSQRKPESYTAAEIDRVWNEALRGRDTTANPVTKRSLVHWARESSPVKFNEINRENYGELMSRLTYENDGRIEHAMAARIVHSMLRDKFIVDTDDIGTARPSYKWFEFCIPGQKMKAGQIYKWRMEAKPDNVHLFIGEHLVKVYNEMIARIRERKEKATADGETRYYIELEKTLKMYKSKLGVDGFQNGIISQAQFMFRDRGFLDELDSYRDVIGVGNGVLKIGAEPKLIRGFHEYKISMFTDTDYIPYDPNSPFVKDIYQALHDIYPEVDMQEFMLFHASTGLDANDSANLILLLCGGGRNGKTTLAKLVHNTLGNQYAGSGKPALLTAPSEKAESANSALMQLKDKRYFYFDEFNENDAFNIARMKAMVNPGWSNGREIYSKATNFRNTCNIICMSNFEFIIRTTDHGTWRRIYYYRNKVKFTENPNPNPGPGLMEKPVNPKIILEWPDDPNYKQAMLSILVHYYSRLCKEYRGNLSLVPVPTIQYETEIFRNSQDAMNRFITEMIVKSPGNTERITLTMLATKYTTWYTQHIDKHNPNLVVGKIIVSMENSKIASMLQHEYEQKFLIGYRLRDNTDEPLEDGETFLRQESTFKPTNDHEKDPPVKVDQPISKHIIGVEDNIDACAEAEAEAEEKKIKEEIQNFADQLMKNQPLHVQNTVAPVIDMPDVDEIEWNDVTITDTLDEPLDDTLEL